VITRDDARAIYRVSNCATRYPHGDAKTREVSTLNGWHSFNAERAPNKRAAAEGPARPAHTNARTSPSSSGHKPRRSASRWVIPVDIQTGLDTRRRRDGHASVERDLRDTSSRPFGCRTNHVQCSSATQIERVFHPTGSPQGACIKCRSPVRGTEPARLSRQRDRLWGIIKPSSGENPMVMSIDARPPPP